MTKNDIRESSLEEIQAWAVNKGVGKFRASQIYHWLWKKSVTSFENMINLPKQVKELLAIDFCIYPIQISSEQISNDNAIKTGFKLFDGHYIEGVLIPNPKRITACISSQAGCSLACSFCATGTMKMQRNLTAGEIYDQVVTIMQQVDTHHQRPLTNIVFMGMGEPLLNYDNVLSAIAKITAKDGLGMASSRITLSTAGIGKMIKKLGDDHVKFNLALSLHAATDEKRSSIMPINIQNSLSVLSKALRYYYGQTGNKVTYEYILFRDFNDSTEDAQNLIKFCRNVPCKVNIIEYNPTDNSSFKKASPKKTDDFAALLNDAGIDAFIRKSRGKDIDAACGQLAQKSLEAGV